MRKIGPILFLVTFVSLGALHALPKNKKTSYVHELPINPAALYQSYNIAYFDGKLLPAVVVGEEPDGERPADQVWLGNIEHTSGSNWYKIQISPRYNPYAQDEEGTILHEMCHQWTWEQMEKDGEDYSGEHGDLWQSCMKRLALKDAFSQIW